MLKRQSLSEWVFNLAMICCEGRKGIPTGWLRLSVEVQLQDRNYEKKQKLKENEEEMDEMFKDGIKCNDNQFKLLS